MPTIAAQQILVPKKVYIGDTAELRCTFNNGSKLLKDFTTNGTTELSLVSQSDFTSTDEYNIKSVTLSPAGVDFYQLTVTFIPWKTGTIQLPPLEVEGTDITIDFQPVQIVSLISTEGTNATTLRDTAAPLLLPGTTYKLYGSITVLIIILIAAIRIIVKRESLLFYINQKRLLKKYKKNKKQTIKLLKQVVAATRTTANADKTDTSTDQASAEKIQKILRQYLEVRFDYPFTKAVTSELMQAWQSATGGLLSDEKTEAFGDITAAFIRTDYIRYSSGGSFNEDELNELVESLIARIELLEKEGEKTDA